MIPLGDIPVLCDSARWTLPLYLRRVQGAVSKVRRKRDASGRLTAPQPGKTPKWTDRLKARPSLLLSKLPRRSPRPQRLIRTSVPQDVQWARSESPRHRRPGQ